MDNDESELPRQDDDATDQTERRPGRAELGLQIVLASGIEFYCSSLGQPTVKLPIDENSDFRVWPVLSDRVAAWIHHIVWQQACVVLHRQEINRIRWVIAGMAWEDERVSLDLMEAMDENPLFEALVLFIMEKRSYDGTCTKLLAEIKKTANSRGIDQRSTAFPDDVAVLGRRIRQLLPLLEKAAIQVDCGRRGGQRYVSLLYDGDGIDPPEASGNEPPTNSPHGPEGQPSTDESDAATREDVFKRIEAKGGTQK